MNTKNKQKGFTLVELVIVIAVIAILAGVLIPTFSGVVENANKAAAKEDVANAYRAYLTQDAEKYDEKQKGKIYVIVKDKYCVHIEDGVVKDAVKKDSQSVEGYTQMKIENGVLVKNN